MNRPTIVKFTLLFCIALVILGLLIYTQLLKKDDENLELESGYIYTDSGFPEEKEDETVLTEEIKESDQKEVLQMTDVKIVAGEVGKEKFKELDFETIIQQRVGKEAYKMILQQAEQAINLLASGEKEGWEEIATPSFINRIYSDEVQLLSYSKVDSLEVFATKQVNEKDIIIGSIIEARDDVMSYQLIFSEQQGVYLIDEIVLMWSN
ncbi:hypothetical protein MHH70_01940 [Metasolibacillus sp. FSL H7-0170]|uniref:hypothetical protein n=1 Tax=Metasolibacillus sp. FSL H7-0170 TaxID=2921431 RepID=UPI0031582C21